MSNLDQHFWTHPPSQHLRIKPKKKEKKKVEWRNMSCIVAISEVCLSNITFSINFIWHLPSLPSSLLHFRFTQSPVFLLATFDWSRFGLICLSVCVMCESFSQVDVLQIIVSSDWSPGLLLRLCLSLGLRLLLPLLLPYQGLLAQ